MDLSNIIPLLLTCHVTDLSTRYRMQIGMVVLHAPKIVAEMPQQQYYQKTHALHAIAL